MEEHPIIVKSYKKVWKIERIFYSLIGDYKLPRPVTLWQCIYFIVAMIVILLLSFNTFLLDFIPFIIRYAVMPGAIAFYLSKIKHDGKAPHRWLVTQIKYFLSSKNYNRYKSSERKGKKKYSGSCTFREIYNIEKN